MEAFITIQINHIGLFRMRFICGSIASRMRTDTRLITSLCQSRQLRDTCRMEPVIVVHGGAGDIPDSRTEAKIIGAHKAANRGYAVLKRGGTSVEAVEAAVRYFETDPAFNCGRGSVLTKEGVVELDACIMDGESLQSGAVTVLRDVEHPISVARLVLKHSPHHLFAGEGANQFAAQHGVPRLPANSLVTDSARKALAKFLETHTDGAVTGGETGTVGAVALDKSGNLAAATSTGGLTGKMTGRCSDSSAVGGGTYADNVGGAASATGHGESIARYCLTHAVSMEIISGRTVQEAVEKCLTEMTDRLKNTAGLIALTQSGDVGIYFNTKRMGWAYRIKDLIHSGIEPGEDNVQSVPDCCK